MTPQSPYHTSLREEELKNKVAADWFSAFDCTRIIGNIDFCVDIPATELALGFEAEPALWAEAKAGNKKDIVASFVQLILTIGGQRTSDKNLPPHFLGAFDAEKIAFLPYNAVLGVLGKNDFDWTVTPSDHESKEFKELYTLAKGVIEREKLLFRYAEDGDILRRFIKANFKSGRRDISKILINKNNFTHIYRQWREIVMPHIDAPWDVLKKKYNIYDRDFYLAEMNIEDNGTTDIADDRVANDFYITFDARSSTPYTVKRKNEDDLFNILAFGFKSGGLDAYAEFWRRYKRPPRKDYWNFIVNRLDLLVPQDVRERKGSFFTPKKWVELSQHYLELELGENWQDEYYVWDCCAGTGNLLAGLTNKYRIWTSTLDQQDVDVMRERAKNGANLLESHIFQFDFLNDPFDRLPKGLKEIIDDPEKRVKLVIYINPPYAEGDNRKGEGRSGVAANTMVAEKYGEEMGYGKRELFIQFLTRIYAEIPGCVIGQFSKLKHLQAPKFNEFREFFKANLEKTFVVPADTFDNVKGQFPVGFFVWRLGDVAFATGSFGVSENERTSEKSPKPQDSQSPSSESNSLVGVFTGTTADVYDRNGEYVGQKTIVSYDGLKVINDWIEGHKDVEAEKQGGSAIGTVLAVANDFQHRNTINISMPYKPWNHQFQWQASENNIIPSVVYFAVRLCMEADWLNDRDQFLFPNDGWKDDAEFQADCLVFALFHGQNRISSVDGVNHWIPFTEEEVGAKDCFKSHFMSEFLNGGAARSVIAPYLQNSETPRNESNETLRTSRTLRENLSPAAKSVLDAGRELWRYYHSQPGANPDASYYDIRLHFQGATTDAKGKTKMNASSSDATYTRLLADLRTAMKRLAKEIEPKVYEYGFLKK